MITCLKCQKEVSETENGYKRHMSKAHGGWTDSDLVAVGLRKTAGSDVARSIAGGHRSPQDVSSAAPATDTQPSAETGGDKTPRKKRGAEDAEKEARKKIAREKLGAILCRKASRGPYLLTATLLRDSRWLLLAEEEKEMVDAMEQFAEAMDLDFSSKYFAILALLAVHSDALAVRIPLLFEGGEAPAPGTDPPTETLH